MDLDVDLMRDLLFELDARQSATHGTISISLDEQAIEFGCHVRDIEAGLKTLRDLAYIDGPEAEAPGFFLFCRLTKKGTAFLHATRRPRDWESLKHHFATRRIAKGA